MKRNVVYKPAPDSLGVFELRDQITYPPPSRMHASSLKYFRQTLNPGQEYTQCLIIKPNIEAHPIFLQAGLDKRLHMSLYVYKNRHNTYIRLKQAASLGLRVTRPLLVFRTVSKYYRITQV